MLTFITITQNDMTAMLGYSSTLIGELMPVIVVILGISIGLWIFDSIFNKNK